MNLASPLSTPCIVLADPELVDQLDVLAFLNPGDPYLTTLVAIVHQVEEHEFEAVVSELENLGSATSAL